MPRSRFSALNLVETLIGADATHLHDARDGDTYVSEHLALELLRRLLITIDAIGGDPVTTQIAAALVQHEGEFLSTTILLNETGIPRATLLRRLGNLEARGFIVQNQHARQTHYRVTSSGAQLSRDTIREMLAISRGRQVGFSREILTRLRQFGFQPRLGARTVAFSAQPLIVQTGHRSG